MIKVSQENLRDVLSSNIITKFISTNLLVARLFLLKVKKMTKILLAEDDAILRDMTRTVLQINGFEVFAYPDGELALEAFLSISPDMVVSDINMPKLDGFGLLDGVRQLPKGIVVPFLFLTGQSERDAVAQARRLGADDLLSKPFEPVDLISAVQSRLERRRMIELFDTRQAHLQTIILLANVIEARDPYTRGHVERVQQFALELGMALNWHATALATLEYGALLHDVGKIVIPEAILNKPGRLTPEELMVIKNHTVAGAHIIQGVSHLNAARPYILYHHERWDGAGYPEKLKGETIPPEGRLLAIVDVYDALTTDRPYHKEMPARDVLNFLRSGSGGHFDPLMVELFCKLQEKKLSVLA
jgi:putative two-component system response regulator